MGVSVLLFLVACLLAPSDTAVLGRCVVARKLHEGGLSDFDGYSLENCEVCLAYFESKFNPTAVYQNLHGGYMGLGLFQIYNNNWCDRGKNLWPMLCSALLNPNLKKTIECAKKIIKGKEGMGA
ncbi:Lysozyme-like protein 4 [Manis javanica]|nr:Lysozyme-like protein 4 [Manis javanica]